MSRYITHSGVMLMASLLGCVQGDSVGNGAAAETAGYDEDAVALGGSNGEGDVDIQPIMDPEATANNGSDPQDQKMSGHDAALLSCPGNGMVAFSASNNVAHVSQGTEALLAYGTTYTNLGGGWVNGGGTFSAPCTGLYTFTVSFVKDAYYNGGTTDDVYVYIKKNNASVGYAWSGEGAGMRGTGTYTVALYLAQGDYVQTFAGSDGGYKRNVQLYNFTGVLVKQP